MADNDTSEQVLKLQVIEYFIRKEIYKRVQYVIFNEDPVKAADFETTKIQLSDYEKVLFSSHQQALLRAEAAGSDDRMKCWENWLAFVDKAIEDGVMRGAAKYITIKKTDE